MQPGFTLRMSFVGSDPDSLVSLSSNDAAGVCSNAVPWREKCRGSVGEGPVPEGERPILFFPHRRSPTITRAFTLILTHSFTLIRPITQTTSSPFPPRHRTWTSTKFPKQFRNALQDADSATFATLLPIFSRPSPRLARGSGRRLCDSTHAARSAYSCTNSYTDADHSPRVRSPMQQSALRRRSSRIGPSSCNCYQHHRTGHGSALLRHGMGYQ
jgi:hypothetical protein